MRFGLGLHLPITGQQLVVGNYAPPTVSSVSPNSGPEVGGFTIIVSGADFQSGAVVFIDGNPAATTFINSQQLSAVTPAGVGLVDVRVDNPDAQTDTLVGGYTYVAAPVVSAITPNTGVTAGGDAITDLAGTGFLPGCSVTFDGVPATSVVRVSDTQITCVTPAHAAGVVDIVVTNADVGTQNSGASGAGLFTYT